MGYNKINIAYQAAIKKAVLADPALPFSAFHKKNPHVKISHFTYQRYRKTFLSQVGREGEAPPRRGYEKKKRTYQLCWKCPIKDFTKNPITGLNSFLEALSAAGRADFELVKVDLLSEGAWKPYLEVRES